MKRLFDAAVWRRLFVQSLDWLEAAWRKRPVVVPALALILGASLVVQWWPGQFARALAPEDMQSIGGHSYYVQPVGTDVPWLFTIAFDDNAGPTASRLILRENGNELLGAHTAHAAIGATGRGGYSHWGPGLFFSSSDNTDPRTNGRRYEVEAPLVLRSDVVVLLVIVALFALSTVVRVALRDGWLRPDDLVMAVPIVAVAAAVVSLMYLAYAAFIDVNGAFALARRAAVKLAMAGTWFAMAAVATRWFQRRDLRSWRLGVALLALGGTCSFLFLRPDVYAGNMLLPSGLSVFGPLLAGVAAAYLPRVAYIQQRYAAFWARPMAGRIALAATIAAVLCLAAPMVWSPVVQNWNASGWMDSHGYDTYAHNIISGQVPEGNSQYMPVYQYGLAAVYFVFGHFFFAQQLVNVLLAFLTVTLVCLSAWNLFRNLWAVLLIGVWAAFARQMFYAVFFTQIESWYVPIVAFGIFAWTSYWRSPSTKHLVLIALACAIGLNTRNQGALYFGWLCLAPLFIASLPWRRRFAHVALAVTILAASLIPWSLRNYAVDGRLSPSSTRSAVYVAVLNDPRIGFYGIRYWEGWGEIVDDYSRRFPDPIERDRAMMSAGMRTPLENFDWFKSAMYWRTLAFYGLLPPGVFATAGPEPTNWATEWRGWVYWRTTPLLLLPLSLFGLLTRPNRAMVFMSGAVFLSVLVVALTGGAEDRVSYPILPIHMLMALAAIFPLHAAEPGWSASRAVFSVARPRMWILMAAGAVVFLVFARLHFGEPNLYAPQIERAVLVNPAVALEAERPSLNEFAATGLPSPPAEPAWADKPVRLRFIAFNYQCPPKFGGRISDLPDFATDPEGAMYYYALLLVPRGSTFEQLPIAVAWLGATVNERLREGDEIEADGRLMLAPNTPLARYWVRIEKARKVVVRSAEIPPFF